VRQADGHPPGRRGPFLGCSGYPKCKNTGEVPAKLMEELELNGNGSPNGNGQGSAKQPSAKAGERHDDGHGGDDEIVTDLSIE
jgi:ssDNA-binding Zn-finger/Zn-ribbon topoisomerase 1